MSIAETDYKFYSKKILYVFHIGMLKNIILRYNKNYVYFRKDSAKISFSLLYFLCGFILLVLS